jgi:hypothetical protein
MSDEIAASEGYAVSQQKRKLIEQGFGWGKLIGPIRQVMVRGRCCKTSAPRMNASVLW